jgi:hypothetical protein
VSLLDLQLLFGLLLLALGGMAGAWAHALVMLGAVVLAHVFRVRAKRLPPDRRPRAEALLYGLSLVFLLVGVAITPA